MSQDELAAASGIDRATISLVENGHRNPTLETLERLAPALGVEMADFFPKAAPRLFPLDPEPGPAPGPAVSMADVIEELVERGVAQRVDLRPSELANLTITHYDVQKWGGVHETLKSVENGETSADEAAPKLIAAVLDLLRRDPRGGQDAPAT